MFLRIVKDDDCQKNSFYLIQIFYAYLGFYILYMILSIYMCKTKIHKNSIPKHSSYIIKYFNSVYFVFTFQKSKDNTLRLIIFEY